MNREKLEIEVLKAQLKRLTRRREYVFNFEYYDENTRGNTIDNSNVVQFEFINQGNTIVNINGLLLQPWIAASDPTLPPPGTLEFATPPNRLTMSIRADEMDVTVYKYKFIGLPAGAVERTVVNSLLVISKVKADIATNKKG